MSRLVDLYHYFSEHMDDPHPAAKQADKAVEKRMNTIKKTDSGLFDDLKQLVAAAAVEHEIRGFALGVASAKGETVG